MVLLAAGLLGAPSCANFIGCEKTRTCPQTGGLGGEDTSQAGADGAGASADAGGSKGSTGGKASASDGGNSSGSGATEPVTCGELTCPANATCTSPDDAPACECQDGFEEDETGCIDTDECQDDPCGEDELCENTPGSFTCTCAPGFYEDLEQCWPDMVLVTAIEQNLGSTTLALSPKLSDDGRALILVSYGVLFDLGTTGGANVIHVGLRGESPRLLSALANNFDLSADGTIVGLSSSEATLVPGDTNGVSDAFVAEDGTIRRVSVSSSGAQGDGPSQGGSLSADGTLVVFHSEATNLVAGDTNGKKDVFLRDLTAGTTQRISISAAGDQPTGHCQDAVVSADGGLVAFQCQGTGITPDDLDEGPEVFVRNVQLGTVERASLGNGPTQSSHAGCSGFTLSGNGRYVAFNSDAPDLVEGDTNGTCDAFLRDLEEDVTILLSVSSNGIQSEAKAGATAISYDGRYVLFGSAASNLVDDDTNGFGDCFVRDVVAGTTTRVSVGPDGQEANKSSECGSLSADGRFVAFHSYATNFGADTQDQYQIWYKRVLP